MLQKLLNVITYNAPGPRICRCQCAQFTKPMDIVGTHPFASHPPVAEVKRNWRGNTELMALSA